MTRLKKIGCIFALGLVIFSIFGFTQPKEKNGNYYRSAPNSAYWNPVTELFEADFSTDFEDFTTSFESSYDNVIFFQEIENSLYVDSEFRYNNFGSDNELLLQKVYIDTPIEKRILFQTPHLEKNYNYSGVSSKAMFFYTGASKTMDLALTEVNEFNENTSIWYTQPNTIQTIDNFSYYLLPGRFNKFDYNLDPGKFYSLVPDGVCEIESPFYSDDEAQSDKTPRMEYIFPKTRLLGNQIFIQSNITENFVLERDLSSPIEIKPYDRIRVGFKTTFENQIDITIGDTFQLVENNNENTEYTESTFLVQGSHVVDEIRINGTIRDTQYFSLDYIIVERPTIHQPDDIVYQVGDTSNIINWIVLQTEEWDPKYSVFCNETRNQTGAFTQDVPIPFVFDTLVEGNYTFLFEAEIGYGQNASVCINVVVNSPPQLREQQESIVVESGSLGNFISWEVEDNSTLSPQYTVIKNGTEIFEGEWNSSDVIKVNIDGLGIGHYVYELEADDGFGGLNKTGIDVFVQFTKISRPEDVFYEIGTINHYITWVIIKYPGFSLNYSIFNNGTKIEVGNWKSGAPITRQIDNLNVGFHHFKIVANYSDTLQVEDEVVVRVLAEPSEQSTEEEEDLSLFELIFITLACVSVVGFLVIYGYVKFHRRRDFE